MNYIWGVDEVPVIDNLVPIETIVTGRNVRSDIGDISDLRESIGQVGIINPLIVCETSEGYVLVAGERRLRAAESLGFEKVPCKIFRSLTDSQIYEIMLAENFNRESMNPIDEGRAFRMMIDKYGYTQQKLGGIVGRSQSYIAKHLSLLDLPEEIQDLVVKGVISPAHALQFLSFRDSFIFGAISDYFSKNVPKDIKPVAQFKDQLAALSYSAAKDAGIDPCYVATYDIGSDAYSDRCSKCENHVGSYCYNPSCHAVLVNEYSESKKKKVSEDIDDSVADHNNSVFREVSRQKSLYIRELRESIEEDVDKVLRESGLDAKGLLDRFILSLTAEIEVEDGRSLRDILSYNCEDYVCPRLSADSSLDDFVRCLIGAFIVSEFDFSIDYQTEGGDYPVEYVRILRDHGLSSSRFSKARIKSIQTDIDIFDKRMEDIKSSEVSVSNDISDLPAVRGEA